MTYEDLLISYTEKVRVKESDFSKKYFLEGFKGLYKNGNILIDKNIETNKEKKCILAEELGHHYTSSGVILDMSNISSAQQEVRARRWGYENIVSLTLLIEAFEKGVRNRFELSEFLDVTEEYICEAIKYYKEKYGVYTELGDYIIMFEPLSILKRLSINRVQLDTFK